MTGSRGWLRSDDGAAKTIEADGTPITAGNFSSTGGEVRQKPVIAAVGTTTPTAPTCYVDDLVLSGIPNDGPQTFRACDTLTVGDGVFNNVTGLAPTIVFTDGFESGDTSVWGPP